MKETPSTGHIVMDGNLSSPVWSELLGRVSTPVTTAVMMPNEGITERFIYGLTGATDTPLEFRLIYDDKRNKGKHNAIELTGTLADHVGEIVQAQRDGFGVFAVVNEGGRADAQITTVRAVFVDFDDKPLPEQWHRTPDIIVRRDENHWHAYWLVQRMEPSEFKAAQLRLAVHYGTDTAICNPSRIMRLPGFWHQKEPTAPRMVTTDRVERPTVIPRAAEVLEGIAELPTRRNWLGPSTATGARLSWAGLRKRLSYIHPLFDGSRPECYPTPSSKRQNQPLPYDGKRAWVGIALCVRDGCIPLLDTEDHDWLALAEEWSDGTLWRERTGESLNVTTFPVEGIIARLAGKPREDGARITVATIIEYAHDGGCPLPPDDEAEASPHIGAEYIKEQGDNDSTDDETQAPAGSDADLAAGFVERHKHELRYDAEQGTWLRYTGARWEALQTPAVWNLARKVVVKYAALVDGDNARKKICSRQAIAAVETTARGWDGILTPSDQFDADPWLLNTPGGTVDLHTGTIRESRPEDYSTKATAVAPSGECPLWMRFLDRVTEGNTELQRYMQRLIGYCLTGNTTEHALAFLFGTGANGKSVLLNTITSILGDYAMSAPANVLEASQNDRHPTELARLQGARLVTALETDQGKTWDEAKVKALTGADPIVARFMHKNFFTYVPTFKLVIAGNHKPRLRNVDEAIRRRLHMIPFTVTIPPAERDPDLAEKLKAEWSGILAWAIQGCLEWQQHGLQPPCAVQDMTREYLAAQDPFDAWLAEIDPEEHPWDGPWQQIEGARFWASAADLYAYYCAHANGTGEPTVNRQRFRELLESHALEPRRLGHDGKRGYLWPRKVGQ